MSTPGSTPFIGPPVGFLAGARAAGRRKASRPWPALVLGGGALLVLAAAVGGWLFWNLGYDLGSELYAPGQNAHVPASVAWQAPDDTFTEQRDCNPKCFIRLMQRLKAPGDTIRFSKRMKKFYGEDSLGYAEKFTSYGPVDMIEYFIPGWGMTGSIQYLFVNGVDGLIDGSSSDRYAAIDLSQSANYRRIRMRHPAVMLWPEIGFSRVERTADSGQAFIFNMSLLDGCHACPVLGNAYFAQSFGSDGTYRGLSLLRVTREPEAELPAMPQLDSADAAQSQSGIMDPLVAARAAATAELLSPPQLTSPAADRVFNYFPRAFTMTWVPSTGARSYKLEVQALDPIHNTWMSLVTSVISSTEYTYKFVGAQPGRWRVTAQDGEHQSEPSEWRIFRFTR